MENKQKFKKKQKFQNKQSNPKFQKKQEQKNPKIANKKIKKFPKTDKKKQNQPKKQQNETLLQEFILTPEQEHLKQEYLDLRPDVEFYKMQSLNKISRYIIDMFSSQKVTPPMTIFERWRWINKYNYDTKSDNKSINKNLQKDGLIPDTEKLEQFTQEAYENQKISKEKAEILSKQIGKTTQSIIKSIQTKYENPPSPQTQIIIKKYRNSVQLYLQNELNETQELQTINQENHSKLLKLYKNKFEKQENDQKFLEKFYLILFTILARYRSFQCPGNQAAIPEKVFENLRDQFQVNGECFASPMNCFMKENYYSAFNDTDKYFGSNGSFFDNSIKEGSFEANPPFIPELMVGMVDHMENQLQIAEKQGKSLSFCVIVPYRDEQTYWQRLEKSSFQKTFFVIEKNQHRYKQGLQQEQKGYKQAVFDTGFVFLQTSNAKKQYPCTKQKEINIRKTMA